MLEALLVLILILVPPSFLRAESIKIGVVLPLSGVGEFWGSNARKGMALALEDLNADSNGAQVELIFEDGKCTAKTAIAAVRKLLDVDKVQFVIGETCSSATMAIAPVIQGEKKVLLSHCTETEALDRAGDYVFRLWPSNERQGSFFAQYVWSELQVKRIDLLAVENDYAESYVRGFKERYQKLGGKIGRAMEYPPNAEDFKAELTWVKKDAPDALLIVSYPKDGVTLIKQARALGLAMPILTSASMNSPSDVFAPLGDAAEGVLLSDTKDTTSAQYKERFERVYDQKWPGATSCAAVGYDSVTLIATAARNAGNTAEKVKGWLAGLKAYQGAAGDMNFDDAGNASMEFSVFEVRNGEAVERGRNTGEQEAADPEEKK